MIKSPSASVDTLVLVINGGIVNVVWPFESVVETKMGFESVVSGFSVIVLVAVGVSALACRPLCVEPADDAPALVGAGAPEPAFVP